MNNIKSYKFFNNINFKGMFGGALSLTVSALIVKFLGLIYKLPLSSLLGDIGMGYFNSAYTVYSFFYLLCTAGVPKAIMILISNAKANNNRKLEHQISKVAIRLFGIVGITFTFMLIILSAPIAKIIGNTQSFYTMITIAPTIIFVSVGGVIRGTLSAHMLLSDVAISQVIEGVGKLVFGLAFAALGHRINLPLTLISALTILGVTIGNIFGFVYLLICYKTKISKEKIGQNSISDKKRISRSIFSISIPITVSAAILSISGLIDLGLIMRMLESIGYTEEQASSLYGNYTTLAVPMFNLAMSLISPITIATLPTIASSYSKGDLTELVDAEKNALDLTSLMAAPMMVGLIIFAKEILTVLFKNSNIDLGVPLLILISPSIYFSSLLIMVNSFLESYGYVKAPMISMLFGGIAKTLAAYFLIKDPRIGISGAPISTVLSYGIALSISLIIYSKKTKRYINVVSPLIRFYLPALVIVLLGKILYKHLSLNIGLFLSLIISIAFIGILYSLYIMFINKSNKSRVLKLAKYTNFS